MDAKWCMQQISRCTAMKAAVLLLSDGGAGTVDLLNRELGLNFYVFYVNGVSLERCYSCSTAVKIDLL